jgi:hypothetical protein
MVESQRATEPLIRARYCQEWLEFVGKDDEPWRSRFLGRISPELRATIDGTVRVGWIPLAIHVKLADILLEAYGIQRAHAYYRRAFAASLRGPLLGPLSQSAARLFGITPGTLARWASRGYDATFKHAGFVVGQELGPGRARIEYRDLPRIATASEAWLQSAHGSAYGAFDFLGVDGLARLDLSGRSAGRLRLDLEWTVPASG